MAKKKTKAFYSVCGQCHKPIDLDTLQKAMSQKSEFIHTCGRVLVRGGTNAEVPIANHDDLSLSDTSESEPRFPQDEFGWGKSHG